MPNARCPFLPHSLILSIPHFLLPLLSFPPFSPLLPSSWTVCCPHHFFFILSLPHRISSLFFLFLSSPLTLPLPHSSSFSTSSCLHCILLLLFPSSLFQYFTSLLSSFPHLLSHLISPVHLYLFLLHSSLVLSSLLSRVVADVKGLCLV